MLKQINSFWENVGELAKRMKIVLAVFLSSLFIMLLLPANTDFFALTNNYRPLMSVVLTYIARMYLPSGTELFAGSMSDPITLYVYAALVFATLITMPIFAYEAIKFINPALYPTEKKMIFPYATAMTVLFAGGALFGFFFLAPSFIQGFFPFYYAVGAIPYIQIMDFYNIIFFTVLVSGFLFVIPIFFILLVKFNIIRTRMVTGKRKWIYVGMLVAALLISPGATPIGDFILFVALAILFEASIFIGKFQESKIPENSTPLLVKWFGGQTTCRFCKANVDSSSTDFCLNCKRSIK